MLELILGGARSGKSTSAVQRGLARTGPVIFVATAQPSDAEMRSRIARHRTQRPSHWQVHEAAVDLAAAIVAFAQPDTMLIVDCITLWIANVLFPARQHGHEVDELGWERARSSFLGALTDCRADVVLVSNEVGWGLVPESPVGRRFRDEQGRMNQELARVCDRVTLVVAGLEMALKTRAPERN